jgi:hypothetical protein
MKKLLGTLALAGIVGLAACEPRDEPVIIDEPVFEDPAPPPPVTEPVPAPLPADSPMVTDTPTVMDPAVPPPSN